jgi:elongation of very long chain fatty acids protein 6
MNFTVHAAMYSYYGFRALRFRIPKWVNIVITSGQISQMVIGIVVNTVAYFKKRR